MHNAHVLREVLVGVKWNSLRVTLLIGNDTCS